MSPDFSPAAGGPITINGGMVEMGLGAASELKPHCLSICHVQKKQAGLSLLHSHLRLCYRLCAQACTG